MNDGSGPTDRVLTYVKGQAGNGATLEEIEDALGMTRREVAAALALLITQGRIDSSGMVRLNRAQRFVNVYIATED